MVTLSQLKGLLHKGDLDRKDKLLLVIALEGNSPKPVSRIVQLAASAGFHAPKKWNVSQILGDAGGLAIRVPNGWELSPEGLKRVGKIAKPVLEKAPTSTAAESLRLFLPSIKNLDTRAFVEEAVSCLEHGLLRAAVVLSWVGAVSVLYHHVVAHQLGPFNAEATRRNSKWKAATTTDDLANMREADLLDLLEAISVIGKSVKLALKQSLDLRNACGHPSSLVVSHNTVAAHIERLAANVFAKF